MSDSDFELVRVGLECLRHWQEFHVDAADERCGHDLFGQIHLEKFVDIPQMDIAKYERLYGVENLVALELGVEINRMIWNETHDLSTKKNWLPVSLNINNLLGYYLVPTY